MLAFDKIEYFLIYGPSKAMWLLLKSRLNIQC